MWQGHVASTSCADLCAPVWKRLSDDIKGALRRFGGDILNQKRRIFIGWLHLHMADPATFLASHAVLGTLFSSENSLFIQLWKRRIFLSLYYYLINIVNIQIWSLNLFFKTT